MSDVLTIVLPLLLLGAAFVIATRFERKIPTRLKVYRFHAILYPIVTVLGLTVTVCMGWSPNLDWWINDAIVHLELVFGISGVALCLALTPAVWWMEHHPDLINVWRIGRLTVNTLIWAPYGMTGALLLYLETA